MPGPLDDAEREEAPRERADDVLRDRAGEERRDDHDEGVRLRREEAPVEVQERADGDEPEDDRAADEPPGKVERARRSRPRGTTCGVRPGPEVVAEG